MIQETSNILDEEIWSIGDPDPDLTGLKVTGWRIILLPVRQKNKTTGGVYIPEQTIDDLQTLTSLCKVLQVGDKAYKLYGEDFGDPWVKEGDYVLVSRLAGMRMRYSGAPLIICSDKEIQCVVADPQKLDKTKYGG